MDKYLVIGNPISHSKSPFIHTLFARQTSQQMSYSAMKAPLDDFSSVVCSFFAQNGKGCNVTTPFKKEAYAFADVLTERARLAGAVNTLKKLDDGGVLGDNTDGAGLVQDLLNHHVIIENARVLLLGAGGAAQGVILPLLEQKPKELIIANRTFNSAQQLSLQFSSFAHLPAFSLESLDSLPFDIIINSTSASLLGQYPAISCKLIHDKTIVYDMMYGSGITSSNQWALDKGALHVIDGLGMLVEQAALSFAIWRGIKPGTRQVLSELRRNLNAG